MQTHTVTVDPAKLRAFAKLTYDWDMKVLQSYRDSATKLAEELTALGLESVAACEDAALYAALIELREQTT